MWEYLFQKHILIRGFDYYNRDLVKDLHVDNKIIKASVYGREMYLVHVTKKEENIINMICSCPHAYDGNNCKHMAAVLFHWESENEDGTTELEVDGDLEESTAKLVEEADEALVRKFLLEILDNDEKLIQRFKGVLGCDIRPSDVKRYKNQINQIFNKYSGRQNFIDYYNARHFALELEEFINDDLQVMLDNQQFKAAFDLSNYVFVRLGIQDMDDSDGGTWTIAKMCLEIWKQILNDCDTELKRNMFQWFTNHLDGTIIDYMEEYIEQIVFENFKEEEFIMDKLIFIEDKIQEYKKKGNPGHENTN